MSSIHVQCPGCQELLDIPLEFQGRNVQCSVCRGLIPVPFDPAVDPARKRIRSRRSTETAPARGNLAVWILVFAAAFVSGTACVGILIMFNRILNPAVQTYTDDKVQFRIQLPGNPAQIVQPGSTGEIRGIEFSSSERNERYWVKYYDITLVDRLMDPKKLLERETDREIKASGLTGKKIQNHTKYDDQPTFDTLMDSEKVVFNKVTVLRLIRSNNRIYVIAVQGDIRPEMRHVRRFFLSFEALGEGAKKKAAKEDDNQKNEN